jgi:peptide/nickel transport system substrate-binding protein
MKRLLAALTALLVLATGCSKPGARGRWSSGDTLQAGAAISPNSFNPILLSESIETDLDGLVFNGLTMENDRNEIVPSLAAVVPTQENGGISKDGRTIVYRLRRRVRWQDGAPFTSRDVAFTWRAIMNPNNLTGNRVPYDEVSSVDTPDAYTAVFRLKQPYAPFVAEAFNSATISYVLPAHLLAGYHDLNHIPFNGAPVGTGPYRLTRWVRGDRIEFAANPQYFAGAPKIAKIVVHSIPDENTGINEMRARDIDWYPYISEASYELLRQAHGLRVVVTPQNAYRGLYMNTERPLLHDARVRRAIAYAIDKKRLVQSVTHGTGTLATEDIASFSWAYYPAVPVTPYDPAKARALLQQVRWKPGTSLTLTLRSGAAGDRQMAVLVQQWLSAVGIQTEIKSYPGSMLFASGPSGVLAPGKYDLDISGFTYTADPDNSGVFTCADRAPNGFNWTRYCSPLMDRLQREALETYDRAARKAAYAKIETLLALDVPQIFIYYQPEISAVNPALKNFRPSDITPVGERPKWTFQTGRS